MSLIQTIYLILRRQLALTIALGWIAARPAGAAVARIEWSSVAESVTRNTPFPASITFKDAAGLATAPFAGGVILRASVFEANPERSALQGVEPNYQNNSGRFDLGWSFTPKRNLRVTALLYYSGVRIRLLEAGGRVLAEQELPEGSPGWKEIHLPQAVRVKAGQHYQIQVDTGGRDYFAFRAFDQPAFSNADLDIHYVDNYDVWLVDFKYTEIQSAAVVTPSLLEGVADGLWSGEITLDAQGSYVFLEAEADGAVGFTEVFQAVPANNLRLTQTIAPTICTVNDLVSYTVRAENNGPESLADVQVTVVLPESVEQRLVSVSQGTHAIDAGRIVFQLGELRRESQAELRLTLVATQTGTFEIRSEATTGAADPMPSDNQVSAEVRCFGTPEIAASDAVVFSRIQSGATTNATFEISLTAPASRNIYVDYRTESDTAVEGQDYQAQTGTLLFAPGVVKQQVIVPVADGAPGEQNERFKLRLSRPVNAVLSRDVGVCQIVNPAIVPTITVEDVRLAEGDEPFGVDAVFRFKLSHPMDTMIVGDIRAIAGSAQAMRWPVQPGESDFYEVWGGFGFGAGQTETTITAPIHGDDFPEPNEVFQLIYSSSMGHTPRTSATATIVNDDPTPAITVGDAFVREGGGETATLMFPVQLSKRAGAEVSFAYRAIGLTATAGADFEAAEGVVTLEAGSRHTTVGITVLPDQIAEALETMRLELRDPVGCVLVVAAVVGHISDAPNQLPVIRINSPNFGATRWVGEPVEVLVEGHDGGGEVEKMALSINGAMHTEASTNQLHLDWIPTSPGLYRLVVQAWDNLGASATSSEWPVEVKSASPVQVLTPANGSVLPAREPLMVKIRYAGEATPQRIELHANATLVGAFSEGAREFTWNDPPEGRHALVVTVVDVQGVVHLSDPINVEITPAPPINDQFADSATLTGYSPRATGTTRGGTAQPNEPIHGNPSARASVWWNWTAPAQGTATLIATNELGEPLYAVVYMGDLETSLVAKAHFVGTGSFETSAGQRYSIAVDGVGTDTGPVVLQLALARIQLVSPMPQARYVVPAAVALEATINAPAEVIQTVDFFEGATLVGSDREAPYQFPWTLGTNGYHKIRAVATDYLGGVRASAEIPFVVSPSNDDFSHASEIAGYGIDITTSNIGATRRGDPTYADNQGGHSLWYRWTAPEDGLCTVFGRGKDFHLLLGAYVGSSVAGLAHVAINAMGGWENPLTFQVAQGTTLNILVDGMFGEEGEINWWLRLRPSNDDASGARQVREPFFEAIASHRGASLEPFESNLHPAGSVSTWWQWRAPMTSPTTVATTSLEARTQIRIYTGSVGNLTLAAGSSDWGLTNSVSFPAMAGRDYLMAILGEEGATNDFGLRINQDLLRMSHPQDGSAHPANSALMLAAVAPESLGVFARIELMVNDEPVGTATEPPYEVTWYGGPPDTYRIQARGVRANGETVSSLPVTIVLYANNQLPKPAVAMNSRGAEGLVVNSVGQLFVFGPRNEFAWAGAHDKSTPRPGRWPENVRQWARVMGGMGDALEHTPWAVWPRPFDYHVWSLTPDGELYRDGQLKLAFPPGVARWTGFFGSGNCLAVGDDGAIYLNGAEKLNLGLPGVSWKDIAIGYIYMARLSTEGDVYVSDNRLTPPPGINFTEMKSSLYALLLRGSDGELYQSGDPKPSATLAGSNLKLVSKPIGVARFTSFALGGFHALAIGDDGELYTWGRNWEGQLGVGAHDEGRMQLQKVPRPPGVTAWTEAAGGYMHSLAIGNDCSLYAWGANDSYQLGLGRVPEQALPQRVVGLGALCGIPAIYADGETTQLEDGRFRIRFGSTLNRPYLIQYSDDVIKWKTAHPPVVGTGGTLEWIDDGPPSTDTHPALAGRRYYRVVFAP